MREFRQDLTGTTDGNGNATIRVPMPQTGEWHNLKFALSTTGSAEWAIQASGSNINFGRGLRPVIGPELIRDHEVVLITVTGGPPNAQISGTATGVSGTPEEIVATYAPQINTIALDVAQPYRLLATEQFAVNQTVQKTYVLPTGINAIELTKTAGSGTTVTYVVTGAASGNGYYSSPGADETDGVPVLVEILNPRDWGIRGGVKVSYVTGAAGTGPQVIVEGTNVPFGLAGGIIAPFVGGAASLDVGASYVVDPIGHNQLRTDAQRPWDWFATSGSVTGAVAVATQAAPGASKRLQIAWVSAWVSDSASGRTDIIEFWQGPLGTGFNFLVDEFNAPAVGQVGNWSRENMKYAMGVNTALNLRLNTSAATETHGVSVAGYTLT